MPLAHITNEDMRYDGDDFNITLENFKKELTVFAAAISEIPCTKLRQQLSLTSEYISLFPNIR